MGRALLILALASASCVRGGAYHCRTNEQCTFEGAFGVCEALGFCSFPDSECTSGYRYGDHAGDYANQCVGEDNSGYVSIGGTIQGLEGVGLVLRNNGIDDLLVRSSGAFRFNMEMMAGEIYEVTIASQPSSPQQTCLINNANGVVEDDDVTDIEVSCSTRTFAIGGTVVGLTGSGLVLTNAGGGDLPINTDGPFAFSMQVPSGAMYAVAIKTQPSGQTCDVSGATGEVGAANVSTVVVNCTGTSYTVGGTVAGIEGTLVVRNNNTDTATITANGTFAFPTPLAPGQNYDVTVYAMPQFPPRNQTCTITGASGNMPSANVTSVAITCQTNSFTIGGNVVGLEGVLMLQNNGSDTLNISTTGSFTFPTPVLSGGAYTVTILSQPPGQSCSMTGSPSGVITNGNITNIVITCGNKTDPGILCGSSYCDPATQLCCIDDGVAACATSCQGSNVTPIRCDSQADCTAQGQPASVCCGLFSGLTLANIYCTTPDHCGPPRAYFCDPNLANPCPDGGTCTPSSIPFNGWYRCF